MSVAAILVLLYLAIGLLVLTVMIATGLAGLSAETVQTEWTTDCTD
jgi:hypothetical protein